ncbi:MAG: DNA-binding protein, partial [Longicatena sp.]
PDMNASSTGWLLVQAIFDNYEDKEANLILSKIIENVGPHLETSGSGPLKKVRSGEVGIAFGLRHQAIKDKKQGLPINYVDPTEGNYQLTESIAVVKKEKNNSNAMAMARCMMEYGRKDLLEIYPTPLYQGEVVDAKIASKYPKVFPKALHIDLLKEHQAIYNKIVK